ncbi:protein spaetzle 4 [Trichonephila inaurata madagascariensis]|uniref:Protein spaetzle 4 n=1 Tax=Trichonephila inaurata madagascariensis TaxID=2747483 RepID=A0A8X6YNS4_9ARAC|nr:protein spaetzle 4 [Trichonephila inaurata madagascariensis]
MLLGTAQGQSCGPRVSARLLAEIPCDMSKSSYCSAPGSAYPWSSVKRYINDNQGLVRRMYGDEKHSSVLLNEIDGFQMRFDMLRHSFFDGFRSRTVYGRSARGHKPARRQPRPQIFPDDEETPESTSSTPEEPATIFRVVTETSIKVGEAFTKPMSNPETTVSYEPASAFDSYTSPSVVTTRDSTTPTTTEDATSTTSTAETTYYQTPSTTETLHTTDTNPSTMYSEYMTTDTTTPHNEDVPVAMQRVGYEEFEEDYEYKPRRKMDSAVLQNSVEEKLKYKDGFESDVKREDPSDITMNQPVDDLIAEESGEDVREETTATTEGTEEAKEEVPRRGINACPVKNEVIAPYWANNTRGETLALLNVHPFEQYVHFEKCAFENHQMLCREGCRCEQQYRLHRLLAFDPKNECRGIFSDWFRFPSCCVCICYDLTPDMPRSRRKGRIEQ